MSLFKIGDDVVRIQGAPNPTSDSFLVGMFGTIVQSNVLQCGEQELNTFYTVRFKCSADSGDSFCEAHIPEDHLCKLRTNYWRFNPLLVRHSINDRIRANFINYLPAVRVFPLRRPYRVSSWVYCRKSFTFGLRYFLKRTHGQITGVECEPFEKPEDLKFYYDVIYPENAELTSQNSLAWKMVYDIPEDNLNPTFTAQNPDDETINKWAYANYKLDYSHASTISGASLMANYMANDLSVTWMLASRKETEKMPYEKVDILLMPEPQKIFFRNPTTIVFWKDGTVTSVRCAKDDVFTEFGGYTAALAKKMYGNHSDISRIIEKARAKDTAPVAPPKSWVEKSKKRKD